MNKKYLFIDMDGVLADFCKSPMFDVNDRIINDPPLMYEKHFFETLPPVAGALSSVRELIHSKKSEIYILSKPVSTTHYSYSEKSAWVWKWFPELGKRIILSQEKSLLSGPNRWLVDDDNKWKDGWVSSGGEFIHFDYAMPDNKTTSKGVDELNRIQWCMVLDKLL